MLWLTGRGRTLGEARQADIDAWYASHSDYERRCLRAFLQWAITNKMCDKFELQCAVVRARPPISEAQRLELLRRLLTDDVTPLRSRIAGIIVVLYAQPLTRVSRLTLDDVVQDGDGPHIRLGNPPSPIPQQVMELIGRYLVERTNMNTATNQGSRWMFPRRRADLPLNPAYLSELLTEMQVPTTAARGAALRQHLLDSPAPVVAEAFGYHQRTAAILADEAGSTWSGYAPGDHSQSQPQVRS